MFRKNRNAAPREFPHCTFTQADNHFESECQKLTFECDRIALTIAFSLIASGLNAYFTSLTVPYFHLIFSALGIATAVLTILTVPIMCVCLCLGHLDCLSSSQVGRSFYALTTCFPLSKSTNAKTCCFITHVIISAPSSSLHMRREMQLLFSCRPEKLRCRRLCPCDPEAGAKLNYACSEVRHTKEENAKDYL
jgi:hypothetical protein